MQKWAKACVSAGVAVAIIQLVNPDPDVLGSMAQDFAVMLPCMRAAAMLEAPACGAWTWLRGTWS